MEIYHKVAGISQCQADDSGAVDICMRQNKRGKRRSGIPGCKRWRTLRIPRSLVRCDMSPSIEWTHSSEIPEMIPSVL